MKFGQLPIGSRFHYQREWYVKTGPLLAATESEGRPRFIGRYADVRVAETTTVDRAATDSHAASAAFEAFYQQCVALVQTLAAHDPQAAAVARAQLDQARRRYLARAERPAESE